MTNQLALVLAIMVCAFFGADFALTDGTIALFLAKKMMAFIEWIAFWR
ncbi:MAG: glyceraldehyde-3-phosphate dehydrogenase [Rhodobacterales bacterium]|nr:MAG: glyceraldehyde-3-phosphate dehydrogenase [Rhodobacterales bacterium]